MVLVFAQVAAVPALSQYFVQFPKPEVLFLSEGLHFLVDADGDAVFDGTDFLLDILLFELEFGVDFLEGEHLIFIHIASLEEGGLSLPLRTVFVLSGISMTCCKESTKM